MLSFIGFLIFKNPALLMIGASITGIGGAVILSKNLIKDIKNLNSNNYKANSSITNLEQEKDVDQILQEGIGKVKGEDFYSEKNKSVVKKKKLMPRRKKKENVEKH